MDHVERNLSRTLELITELDSLKGSYYASPDILAELNYQMRSHVGDAWVDPLPRESLESTTVAGGNNRGFVHVGYQESVTMPVVRWDHQGRMPGSLVRRLRDELLEDLATWLCNRFAVSLKRLGRRQMDAVQALSYDFRASYHGGLSGCCDSENSTWSGCRKPLHDNLAAYNEEQFMGAVFPEGTQITCLEPRVLLHVMEIFDERDTAAAKLNCAPGCVPYVPGHTVPSLCLNTQLYVKMPEPPRVALYSPRRSRSANAGLGADVVDAIQPEAKRTKVQAQGDLDWYLDK